jgi:hypothetical protein
MNRTLEARFWQTLGLAVGVFGGLLLAYTSGRYGLASIDHRAIHYGMASGFIQLAGAAAFLAGRALHVEEVGLTSRESLLWNLLSAVCIIGGLAIVMFAWAQHRAMVLDRMATGLGGAFAIMLGILCLVGQRVMSHIQDAVVERSEQRVRERLHL